MPGRARHGLIQSPDETGRPEKMIDIVAIKARFETLAPYLDERARRLFAASEARAAGRGGVAAVSEATGIARSTIGRGLAELRSGNARLAAACADRAAAASRRSRRNPGFWKRWRSWCSRRSAAIPRRPCCGSARASAIWLRALAERGFTASQKLVGRLLRRLGFSLQANRKTREGTAHPDRDAQFEHINAKIKQFQAPVNQRSRSTPRRRSWSATSRMAAASCAPKASPSRSACTTSSYPNSARSRPTVSTTSPPTRAGSISASTTTPRPSRSRASGAGGTTWGRLRYPGATRLADHRRLRRQQWRSRAAVEARTAGLRRRNRAVDHRRPSAARHQQMEPHRAPAVRLHHPELARQAAGQPRGHHPADRQHHHEHRPRSSSAASTRITTRRASRSPTRR